MPKEKKNIPRCSSRYQNSRQVGTDNFHPTIDTKDQLYPGDIILSIDGTDLGGQTFTNACKLFPKLPNQHDKSTDSTNGIHTDAFEQDMEHQQVSKLKMAVFAPRLLTVMVLSAILHIHSTVDTSLNEPKLAQVTTETQEKLKGSEKMYVTKDIVHSNESTLGKRSCNEMSPSEDSHVTKKRKSTHSICSDILARILMYISRTWGHVFTELDHVDYAW